MKDLIVGDELPLIEIKRLSDYILHKGNKGLIGESFILAYSNNNLSWVLSFMLIQPISKTHDVYRLIYKYTK